MKEAKLMRPFREFINRTSHEHGELIPNSTVDLQDGTKARKGTQFVFVPYEGSENSLVEFQGRTDKDKLVFKAEGPLATEVCNNYRGCDWPNCELIYLKEGEAKICLVCYPKPHDPKYSTRIKSDQNITGFCCPFSRYCECRYNKPEKKKRRINKKRNCPADA